MVVLLESVFGGWENGPGSCAHCHLTRERGRDVNLAILFLMAVLYMAILLMVNLLPSWGEAKQKTDLGICSILQGPFCLLPMRKTATRDQSVLQKTTQMKIYPSSSNDGCKVGFI